MSIAALSTTGFSQYLALTSNVGGSQQAWQSLQQGLAAGNLTAAQTASNTYQQLNQNVTGASVSSQFATDMTALGKAIGSGDLTQAQQAFATVQSDLKDAPSPVVQRAENAVAQTVDQVDELLGFNNSASTDTAADPATSILDSAYGLSSSQTTTDPTVALLEPKYGPDATANPPASSAGNSGTAASINAYA
jgi:ribosomal protein S20